MRLECCGDSRKGAEEIHLDRGSHPGDRSERLPCARWRQAAASVLGTWVLYEALVVMRIISTPLGY